MPVRGLLQTSKSAKALEIGSGLGWLEPTRTGQDTFVSSFLSVTGRLAGCLRSTAQPIHVAGLPVFKDSVLLLHG